MSPKSSNDLSDLLEASDIVRLLPKDSLKDYRHKHWAKILKVNQPDIVISSPSLEELFKFHQTGEKATFVILSDYLLNVVGDRYSWNNTEDTSYLIGEEPGSQSILIELKEQTKELNLHIQSLTVFPTGTYNKKVTPESDWEVDAFYEWHDTKGYYDYNGSVHYKIKSVAGKVTWVHTKST